MGCVLSAPGSTGVGPTEMKSWGDGTGGGGSFSLQSSGQNGAKMDSFGCEAHNCG